jgi:hypothetical protein
VVMAWHGRWLWLVAMGNGGWGPDRTGGSAV